VTSEKQIRKQIRKQKKKKDAADAARFEMKRRKRTQLVSEAASLLWTIFMRRPQAGPGLLNHLRWQRFHIFLR
jgi:hypothetical protein